MTTKDNQMKHDNAETISNGYYFIHDEKISEKVTNVKIHENQQKETTITTKKFCVISFFILNAITYHKHMMAQRRN